MSYISPAQLNVQIPFNVAPGTQPVVVSTIAGGETAGYNITINRLQPGLLTTPDFLINGTKYTAALFPDAATFVLPPGAIPGVPSHRARPGDFIVLYGVGFGPVTPEIPAGRLAQETNNVASPVQINIVIPQIPPRRQRPASVEPRRGHRLPDPLSSRTTHPQSTTRPPIPHLRSSA